MAYATNGREIWEIDAGGAIRQRPDFPSPDELWERFCASEGVESPLEREMLLAPFDSSLRDYNLEPKRPRYYQRIAVNRALRAIARGQRRILLTLATGTGKTMVALQLVAKLRKAGWTAGRMPRVCPRLQGCRPQDFEGPRTAQPRSLLRALSIPGAGR
ncbi:MAG: DEAD/DEAH box helicase family protein [Pseudonocardiaceae bacterium]